MDKKGLSDEVIEILLNANKGHRYHELVNKVKESRLDTNLYNLSYSSDTDPFNEFLKLNQVYFDTELSSQNETMVQNFERLVKWRELNPEKWPKQLPPKRRLVTTEAIIEENGLAVWLANIRKNFKQGNLSYYWISEFEKIGFVLDPIFNKMLLGRKESL